MAMGVFNCFVLACSFPISHGSLFKLVLSSKINLRHIESVRLQDEQVERWDLVFPNLNLLCTKCLTTL